MKHIVVTPAPGRRIRVPETGAIIHGEMPVVDSLYYRRRIAEGDLVEVVQTTAAPPAEAASRQSKKDT